MRHAVRPGLTGDQPSALCRAGRRSPRDRVRAHLCEDQPARANRDCLLPHGPRRAALRPLGVGGAAVGAERHRPSSDHKRAPAGGVAARLGDVLRRGSRVLALVDPLYERHECHISCQSGADRRHGRRLADLPRARHHDFHLRDGTVPCGGGAAGAGQSVFRRESSAGRCPRSAHRVLLRRLSADREGTAPDHGNGSVDGVEQPRDECGSLGGDPGGGREHCHG